MTYVLGALLAAYLISVAAKRLSSFNLAAARTAGRGLFGLVVLAAALAVAVHGQVLLAIGLALIGFWWMGRNLAMPSWTVSSFSSNRTGASRLRSAMIEMEIEHASGRIKGLVLAGQFEGKALDDLSRVECLQLHAACLYQDGGGARLLEAYLDRRFTGWRQAAKGNAHARPGGDVRMRAGAMSFDEAYEILGLRQGAGREDIVRAHRTLMKKWHPDHGGSTDLAARVNEAKEVLMRRHL